VSFSWVDPHFSTLYARREEERLAKWLVTRLRQRAACEPSSGATLWREGGWIENDAACRGAHFRLI
jgi:hypothetical protein